MPVLEFIVRYYVAQCSDCGTPCPNAQSSPDAAIDIALHPLPSQSQWAWTERCEDSSIAGVQKTRLLCATCAKAPDHAK